MSEPFSEKLAFALKALSLSRGGLAAELDVDKSVVSRWVAGTVRPSAHNLARLTALIGQRIPGFRSLDWDRGLTDFSALLGVGPMSTSAMHALVARGGLPLAFMGQIVTATALRGAAYEGFFRSTRPFADSPGRFLHDHCMVRKDEAGLLRLSLATGGVFVDGWVLPLKDQIFIVGADFENGGLVFGLLNGVKAAKVEVLDGLVLSPILDATHTPTATTIVLERIEDLSGDKAVDDARFTQLAAREWVAPEGSVSEALQHHLARDSGPTPLAAGGDWVLRTPLSRSISRGRTPV